MPLTPVTPETLTAGSAPDVDRTASLASDQDVTAQGIGVPLRVTFRLTSMLAFSARTLTPTAAADADLTGVPA